MGCPWLLLAPALTITAEGSKIERLDQITARVSADDVTNEALVSSCDRQRAAEQRSDDPAAETIWSARLTGAALPRMKGFRVAVGGEATQRTGT